MKRRSKQKAQSVVIDSDDNGTTTANDVGLLLMYFSCVKYILMRVQQRTLNRGVDSNGHQSNGTECERRAVRTHRHQRKHFQHKIMCKWKCASLIGIFHSNNHNRCDGEQRPAPLQITRYANTMSIIVGSRAEGQKQMELIKLFTLSENCIFLAVFCSVEWTDIQIKLLACINDFVWSTTLYFDWYFFACHGHFIHFLAHAILAIDVALQPRMPMNGRHSHCVRFGVYLFIALDGD